MKSKIVKLHLYTVGYSCEGQIAEKCATLPVDEASTSPVCDLEPSTSDTINPIRKKKKANKFTQEMVLEQQHKVLLGQLKQQDIDLRNSKLKQEKLTLQVKLLQKVLDRQNSIDINPTELLMSLIS